MCFTGHRDLEGRDENIRRDVNTLLEALYLRGYRRFLCGGALGFDLLAAECVLELRKRHADVKLVMVLPCADQSRRWPDEACRRYEHIVMLADENRVLSPGYYQGCMMVRNRHMVDRSSVCVCYLCKAKGGTMSTAAYAAKSGLTLLNVAIRDVCAAYVREAGVRTFCAE